MQNVYGRMKGRADDWEVEIKKLSNLNELMNVNKTKNDNFDMNKSKTEGTYLGIYYWDN